MWVRTGPKLCLEFFRFGEKKLSTDNWNSPWSDPGSDPAGICVWLHRLFAMMSNRVGHWNVPVVDNPDSAKPMAEIRSQQVTYLTQEAWVLMFFGPWEQCLRNQLLCGLVIVVWNIDGREKACWNPLTDDPARENTGSVMHQFFENIPQWLYVQYTSITGLNSPAEQILEKGLIRCWPLEQLDSAYKRLPIVSSDWCRVYNGSTWRLVVYPPAGLRSPPRCRP